MLTDFISIISFTFESNYLISSLESSNGEPSLVSTTSIPTPPPSPLITRQRHANLCNNKGTVDNIISQLGFAFALKDLGPLNYFLGTEIVPHVSGILLSQKKYILELLQSDDLSNCKPVSSPMVCQYIHASIENHWSAVKRILRYLYGNPDTSLEALSDADWAGDSDDRRSTRGFSIYLALADTVVELTWLQALLYELGIRSSSTPILWCDNLGATYLSANPIFRVRTKHIEIDYTLFGKRMVTCGYPWPEIEGKGFDGVRGGDDDVATVEEGGWRGVGAGRLAGDRPEVGRIWGGAKLEARCGNVVPDYEKDMAAFES
ncbi:gag/pol polyprotein [Tanacetum coccineum]